MTGGKTSTLTFRIEPALKAALRAAATCEHRSVANMVEVLIREYCARSGIAIAEKNSPADASHRPRKTVKRQK